MYRVNFRQHDCFLFHKMVFSASIQIMHFKQRAFRLVNPMKHLRIHHQQRENYTIYVMRTILIYSYGSLARKLFMMKGNILLTYCGWCNEVLMTIHDTCYAIVTDSYQIFIIKFPLVDDDNIKIFIQMHILCLWHTPPHIPRSLSQLTWLNI